MAENLSSKILGWEDVNHHEFYFYHSEIEFLEDFSNGNENLKVIFAIFEEKRYLQILRILKLESIDDGCPKGSQDSNKNKSPYMYNIMFLPNYEILLEIVGNFFFSLLILLLMLVNQIKLN
ncbi:hypothetical protein LCGC14_2197510, partial [marine sediment metagenome]